jgi:hypothetical protein
MSAGKSLRVLLTDGRELTLVADSYRRINSIDQGAGHMFTRSGDSVAFVPSGQLSAVVAEDAIRGHTAKANGATNGKASRPAARRLVRSGGKRNGKGRH